LVVTLGLISLSCFMLTRPFVRTIYFGMAVSVMTFEAATGVLHLWHPESDRSCLPENQRRLDEVERSDRFRAIAGMSGLGALPQAEAATIRTGRG
jgi:hypothetical protein